MNLSKRRTVALLSGLAFLIACGDDGPSGPGFAVELVHPGTDDTIYAQLSFTLEASVAASDGTPLDVGEFEFDWDFGDGTSASGGAASVDHIWGESGALVVSVTARRLRENGRQPEADAHRSVFVHPAADLAVDDATLTLTSSIVRSGDTFRLSGNVINLAAEVPSPFDVGFFVGSAPVLADRELDGGRLDDLRASGLVYEVGRLEFDSLGAQPAQAVVDDAALSMPDDAPTGEYVAFIFADPDGVVGEDDETNNAAFADRTLNFENDSGEGIDLVPSGVGVRPTLANTLSSVSLSATITNVGSEFADGSEYAVYLSPGNPTLQPDEDRLLATGIVETLADGGQFRVTDLPITIDPPVTDLGQYFVLVVADSGDALDETNEDNNVSASPRITVTDVEVPGADIVPTAFAVLPGTTYIGGSVQIDLTVANRGDEPVDRQFNCKFYLSEDDQFDPNIDPLFQTMLVDPLGTGEERDHTMDAFVPPVAPGAYYPFAACDPSLLIPEADDSNNVIRAAAMITIASEANVDLTASEFTLDPLEVPNGEPVSVAIDVCNTGSNGSTPSVVRVFISSDGVLDNDDTVLLESRVPPIDAGGCITIAADVPAVCDTFASLYTVFAAVDVTDLVAELDETNNVVELADDFEITSLVCVCEPDAFEPDDSPFTAAFLDPVVGRYEDLTMCTSNVDYYYLPLLRDETVRVTIDFEHERGDLDMQLFALDRSTVLDESETFGDREEVSYLRVPQRGNYLLRVQGKTSGDRNVYDLDLQVSSPTDGTDLIVLDVSVDDERPVLGDTVSVCFDIVNLGSTPAGASLARVYLSEDTDIDPLTDRVVGSLEVEAFESRIFRCVDARLPEDSGGGARYLAVVADARDDVPGELSETNNTGFSPVIFVDDACFDVLEPNNSADAPRAIDVVGEPPVTMTDLLVCTDNRDFYEFCASDGDFLSLTANFDPVDGDLDMKLWQGASEVDRSEGVGASENVGVDYVAGDRCYTLEIYVAGRDREVPYELVVDTGRAPDELACSRAEEPNDDFGNARPLRDFLDECAAVCPTDDEDYFWVNLTAGTDVAFHLTGEDGADPPSELRITLYGASRNFLGNTVTATEVLEHFVQLSDRHFLRVRSNGDGPRNQPYCIVADGLSGTDLVPSDFSLETGTAGPGDTVRFTFQLANTFDVASPAAKYAVYLSVDPVLSDDDRLLREVDLAPLDGLDERTEGRRFDVPADIVDGGDYRVILAVDSDDDVAEFNEVNNILLSGLVVTPRCVPDSAEPNNFPVDAVAAAEVLGVELSSCGSDDADWFEHETTPEETVTFRIDFADADGDLDLYVYEDHDGVLELAGLSDSITDGESVTIPAATGGTYFIKVAQHTDRSPVYTLTVE